MIALVVLSILVPMALAAAFLLGRHASRRIVLSEELSPVTRQHIDLFQGGQLNEALLEAAKSRLRELLEKGELAAVEASLRPGMHYVVHVRALAEIGTDDAGRLLRRAPQMREPLGDDIGDFEGLEWQLSRLAMLEPVLTDYCQESASYLRAALPNARGIEVRDALLALNDLRAEAAAEILPLLE